ncbi:beta-phosphoglucomutase family hydrolase [Patulibacter sp. SYSU D01012]|uniref:beta-phosphoglucomutase family hydrolase n=1 Tax=Patulibacter sp. SYSU D01012 TaxID=2817381 RepID=UPI0032C1BA24
MPTRLPAEIRACLFDMDGVLTDTARVHARAWKETFDALLAARPDAPGEDHRPFDARADYDAHVDGLPREDGVRNFLASRGIHLPEGTPDDAPDADTVHGVGTRKNALVGRLIDEGGVQVYPGSVALLDALRADGVPCGVVSSSANCRRILDAGGILDRFAAVVDGTALTDRGLRGKPAPDAFLAAAADLGVEPAAAAVFEDALAGVQAGRAGGFGLVVGVDRVGQADALRAHGAGRVVADLQELVA